MKSKDQQLLEEAYSEVRLYSEQIGIKVGNDEDKQKIAQYIRNGCKGDLDLEGTYLTKLPDQLKRVEGELNLMHASVKKLPSGLKFIGGCLTLQHSDIRELPDDLTVGGWINLWGCEKLKKLPKNLKVGDDLEMTESSITSVEQLSKGLEVKGQILSDSFTEEEARKQLKIYEMEKEFPEIEGIFR